MRKPHRRMSRKVLISRYLPDGQSFQRARHHGRQVWCVRVDGYAKHVGETLTDGTDSVIMWAESLDKLARELVKRARVFKQRQTNARKRAEKAAYDKQGSTK